MHQAPLLAQSCSRGHAVVCKGNPAQYARDEPQRCNTGPKTRRVGRDHVLRVVTGCDKGIKDWQPEPAHLFCSCPGFLCSSSLSFTLLRPSHLPPRTCWIDTCSIYVEAHHSRVVITGPPAEAGCGSHRSPLHVCRGTHAAGSLSRCGRACLLAMPWRTLSSCRCNLSSAEGTATVFTAGASPKYGNE